MRIHFTIAALLAIACLGRFIFEASGIFSPRPLEGVVLVVPAVIITGLLVTAVLGFLMGRHVGGGYLTLAWAVPVVGLVVTWDKIALFLLVGFVPLAFLAGVVGRRIAAKSSG